MSRCRAPATACRNGTLVLVACLLLAACAGQPVREAPPVASGAATATQEAREAALREVDAWSLEGRVALANDGRGGSGRLDWHQAGTRSTVSLSAPITRQSWRLTAGPGGATPPVGPSTPRRARTRCRFVAETGWPRART